MAGSTQRPGGRACFRGLGINPVYERSPEVSSFVDNPIERLLQEVRRKPLAHLVEQSVGLQRRWRTGTHSRSSRSGYDCYKTAQ